jgi:hypothetical protein
METENDPAEQHNEEHDQGDEVCEPPVANAMHDCIVKLASNKDQPLRQHGQSMTVVVEGGSAKSKRPKRAAVEANNNGDEDGFTSRKKPMVRRGSGLSKQPVHRVLEAS